MLLEFIFFQGNQIKTKKEISNSLLEIVKTSYSNNNNQYSKNYNFLLFYTTLSILINKENYESIFIKAQLLQMINNYIFAEATYLKIPKKSK